jgi:S-DNA-T family DNA segregation ATPase FtsK/SpoIIIE
MYSAKNLLLGQWIVELVFSYFKSQKKVHSDKLFIKVAGLDDHAWGSVLATFRNSEKELSAFYRPVIRTLRQLAGFDEYNCKSHETSTWLRNNTLSGHALLIFMNDVSAEAQSLENIFTIDEARLLNPDGLQTLYELLAHKHQIYGSELEELSNFIRLYSRITEPQLRHVLSFVSAVIADSQSSMIEKIHRNMNHLLLFRDSKFSNRANDFSRLKRNIQLARLEQDGRSLDKAQLIENMYSFIEKTTSSGDTHELWEQVHPDFFRKQVIAFINRQSYDLLRYELETISTALLFKVKKPKINELIHDFKSSLENQEDWDNTKDKLFADTLEAINGRDPDTIQEFIEEFSTELEDHKKLKKDLERIVNKQRQLAEYKDLSEAILQESIRMLDEYSSEQEEVLIRDIHFKLSLNSPVSNEEQDLYRFHLMNLHCLTKYVSFDEKSFRESTSTAKTNETAFKLELIVNNTTVDESKFKLIDAFSGALTSMLDQYKDGGFIPYICKHMGDEIRSLNIIEVVRDRVSGYVATGNTTMEEAADGFYQFVGWYNDQIKRSLKSGICSIDFATFELKLEELLREVHKSANIAIHVYQHLNYIGVLDEFDTKINEKIGHTQRRTVTLLNPLRLLSYSKRLAHIQSSIDEWHSQQQTTISSVADIEAFIQQKCDEVSQLAPRYFVVEGVQDLFLIEQQEAMGEGYYTLNGDNSGENQKVETFSEEILATVKSYLDVYPYARDCLDIVFIYCPHAEYVIRAVDLILKSTKVQKVRAVVHSDSKGAELHDQLNNWMNLDSYHTERFNSFPRVEVQVIAEQSINTLMQTLQQYLVDADIGVMIDYFGSSSNVKYRLEKVNVVDSDNWFHAVFKEPFKRDDRVKRVNFISEKLPKVLQFFYQMQVIAHNGEAIAPTEHYLLRNTISIQHQSDEQLINFMHEIFNWSLFIDRHLDKTLLEQVSSKAQIIKYKSSAGTSKRFRTIVSSSKYIRKLIQEAKDHEYYDRLHLKYLQLLRNDKIEPQRIIEAVEWVKSISGGVVLRAAGPGKFAHEMMAIYLTMKAVQARDGELVVWSVCDELPWFQGSARRPDLVRTGLSRVGDRIRITFEVMELKFISHTIFESERYDAVKQVKAGLEVYKSRFMFSDHPASANLWRRELVDYLLEYTIYSVEEAELIKFLQEIPIDRVDVDLSGSIHTFVYTSNMLDLTIMHDNQNGYQTEILLNEYTNHIYNRSYILRALGVAQETTTPVFEETENLEKYVANKMQVEKKVESEEVEYLTDLIKSSTFQTRKDIESGETQAMIEAAVTVESVDQALVSVGLSKSDDIFPERLALEGISIEKITNGEDIQSLVESYKQKLRYNFNQIGVRIKIVESHIGISVIRFVIELPVETSYNSVANKANDIYLWLKLQSVPIISLLKGNVIIDINRENPETVYFDDFMALTRSQFSNDKLKGKLIAPIGVGQLRELIFMDFSSSNTPHLLIGGTTGSGKSVTINSIILAMMCLYTPSEVEFVFIDPKKVEFKIYENKTHTKRVITEIEEAVVTLEQLVDEMERRYELFSDEGVMSIDEYVDVTGEPLPRLVVVFDEFADFMGQEKSLSDRVENSIQRLGAKARASGIHLLICTQNPKADIVPTNIRNNLPARLALKTADHHASKIIINEEGAEKLGGRGDFLVKLDMPEILRARSPFLTANVRRALLKYFTKN